MDIKSLTIQKVPVSEIETFHKERAKLKKTPADYFSIILHQQKPEKGSIENNDSSIELSVAATKIREQSKTIEKLENKIQELQSSPPVEVEVEKKLQGTQFIFEPSDAMAKNMRRAISYMIKQGELKKDSNDLVEKFTEQAVNYFIKNEYNHILK